MTVDTAASSITDEEIVSRTLLGEKQLFEILIRRFNVRLYRIGMAIISDDMEVEDAMQTAYLNAYQHLAEFQSRSQFSTWLTRIFINECLRSAKRKKRESATSLDNLEVALLETPVNGIMNNELKNLLEDSIARLPEKYRMVFVMREVEEISTQETMEILSLTESNVKVRLNRAKEMLRSNLDGYYRQTFNFHLNRCDRVVDGVMKRILD